MVKNAEILLQKNNATIAKAFTDENGQATIKAPVDTGSYDFIVKYNGIIIHQEPVKLGVFQKLISPEKNIEIERYNLNLKITDSWRQTPEVELNPAIIIKNMAEPIRITGEKISDDEYVFTNLTPNDYQISLSYRSFNFKHDIKISENEELKLQFPAEYDIDFNVMNERGEPIENSKIIITRNNDKLEIENQESKITVAIPPGKYQVKIYNDDDELIGKRYIDVYGKQYYDLITNDQPFYLTLIILIGLIVIIFSMVISYIKKEIKYFYIPLIVILIFVSIFLPWWQINGSTSGLETSNNLYFIPTNMMTITSTADTIAGESSYLPDEFFTATHMIIILAIAGSLLIIINQFLKKIGKRDITKLSKAFTFFAFSGSLGIFTIAIDKMSKISIGGIIGTGYLDIGVPGESQIHSVNLTWGFGIGFYLFLMGFLFFIIPIIWNLFKKEKN